MFDIPICFKYIYIHAHVFFYMVIFMNPKSIISCSTYDIISSCRSPFTISGRKTACWPKNPPRNGTLDHLGPRWVDDFCLSTINNPAKVEHQQLEGVEHQPSAYISSVFFDGFSGILLGRSNIKEVWRQQSELKSVIFPRFFTILRGKTRP